VAHFWTWLAWGSLAAWSVLAPAWWWRLRRLPTIAPAAGRPRRAAPACAPAVAPADRHAVAPAVAPADRHAVPPAGAPTAATRPTVAIVAAARDEASSILAAGALAAAARGWLEQDGVDVEVVAVDDRSSDATAAVLQAALGDDPRARLLRVGALPEGWLGKVHAQALGVAATTAPWVLLTDADVRLHPEALRLALRAADHAGADHLALLPRFGARGPLLRAFVTGFALLLTVLLRPWEAPDPRSPRTLGSGRSGSTVGRRWSGPVAWPPSALGPTTTWRWRRRSRRRGGAAPSRSPPRWWRSTGTRTSGGAARLEKNAFAGVGYRPGRLAAAVVGLLATHVAPFALALAGPLAARPAAWGVVAIVAGVYALHGRRADHPAWLGLLHPVTVLLLVAALLRSAGRALTTGQVVWRGRRYPVAELRAAAGAAEARDRAAARARVAGRGRGVAGDRSA
jgi:hypothetical protein